MEQLTKILRDLGIPYMVAEDEANVGRPISKKVRDTMDQCGAAILISSADVEHFDKDQKSIWHSSENVSHELGAEAVMYDDRVILFKEQAVDLANNFSGIGYIPFEKDRLDAEMSALLRELVAPKFLKLSVGDDNETCSHGAGGGQVHCDDSASPWVARSPCRASESVTRVSSIHSEQPSKGLFAGVSWRW